MSNMAEVFVVLTLGFGLFIYSSTTEIISNSSAPTTQTYNSYDFVFIIVYEIVALTILAYFLKLRHWTLEDFNLDFSVKMLVIAMLLVIIRETTGILVSQALKALRVVNPETITETSISLQSNIVSIGLIVIVNSIYEEVLLIGYFFKRFEKYHPAIIILISFIVRASFHTYQGWASLPKVFILALVFGLYYLKFKKLWPVIIAHGIGNIFHFLNNHYQWLDI
jgi:membrane protease YdiL (CAAX protease family)